MERDIALAEKIASRGPTKCSDCKELSRPGLTKCGRCAKRNSDQEKRKRAQKKAEAPKETQTT